MATCPRIRVYVRLPHQKCESVNQMPEGVYYIGLVHQSVEPAGLV